MTGAPTPDIAFSQSAPGLARNLHRAAQLIAQNGGQLPTTADRLRELPDVGAYTAGAIASIAFGEPTPMALGRVADTPLHYLAL